MDKELNQPWFKLTVILNCLFPANQSIEIHQQSDMSFIKNKHEEYTLNGMNIHFKTLDIFLNNFYMEMIHVFISLINLKKEKKKDLKGPKEIMP